MYMMPVENLQNTSGNRDELENHPGYFEFITVPGRVLQIFDRHHVHRIIWTDGRELPKVPDPRMLGWSVGKWRATVCCPVERF